MGDPEAQACDQCGGPGFFDAFDAVHHEHQPERHEDRQERQLSTGHGANLERVDAGYLARHNHRNPQCAKGDRRGVGDQAQARGVQRVQAQADQQRGGDRHGRAETCRPLKERTEAEGNQQHLQALVIGNGHDRAADDFELTAFDCQFVEENRSHDDPGDGPQPVRKPISSGRERHASRHLERKDCDQHR